MLNVIILCIVRLSAVAPKKCYGHSLPRVDHGLYYKIFTIVIYDRNAIGQYYETTNVDYDRS